MKKESVDSKILSQRPGLQFTGNLIWKSHLSFLGYNTIFSVILYIKIMHEAIWLTIM